MSLDQMALANLHCQNFVRHNCPEPRVSSNKGDLSPLLDLGVGFHPLFTGRENIGLSCRLLGMNDEQLQATPQILQFAELGEFIDFPVRTYSRVCNCF